MVEFERGGPVGECGSSFLVGNAVVGIEAVDGAMLPGGVVGCDIGCFVCAIIGAGQIGVGCVVRSIIGAGLLGLVDCGGCSTIGAGVGDCVGGSEVGKAEPTGGKGTMLVGFWVGLDGTLVGVSVLGFRCGIPVRLEDCH
jgi:hypothetical protein